MAGQITLRQWTDVVRRARLGRTVKAVALVLATYADSDGTRVFPGIARLSYEAEVTYNTAQKALARLREVQLIEVVKRASRRGDADEYRLIFGDDLMELVDIPSPAQVERAVNEIRGAKQGQWKGNLHPTGRGAGPVAEDDLHPTALGAGALETTNLHPTPWGMAEAPAPHGVWSGTRPAPHGATDLHPTPWGPTVQDLATTTTAHSDGSSVTDRTLPAREPATESESAAEVIDFEARRASLTAPKCSHRMQGGNRADGKPNCPICRALGTAVIPSPRGAPG